MKRLQNYVAGFAIVAMLFSSCSKEDEASVNQPDQEMATISFGPLLNDLMNNRSATKQSVGEFPECSNDDPAYVGIILSSGGNNVVGEEGEPFRVDLAANQLFTQEVPELELEPGVYSLDYFAVYNSDNELIWLAPRGGSMGEYLDSTLPLSIDLGAGVKKYVEVSVLCFDDRLVNEYGYLFFELDGVQAIEFCIFGNYCDENGRHYPAAFNVDVWTYINGEAETQIYSDLSNSVTMNDDGDYAGTTVCVALPDTDGLNEYYFEITLLNSDAYGNVTEEVIRSGVITDDDVRDLFVGDDANNYYHFREGDCNLSDSPDLFEQGGGNGGEPGECDPNNPNADCDNDGVNNSVDQCLDTDPGVEVDEVGCESIQVPGRDIVVFNDINIFDNNAMEDADNVRLVQNLVNFTTGGVRNSGDVVAFDFGRGSQCYGDGQCAQALWASMWDVISDDGFTVEQIFSNSGTLVDIPSDIKTLFLVVPLVDYTLNEINALKEFAAEGGRIVFIGEHEVYYQGISLENQFLQNMGAVLHNTGGAQDCNYTTIPSSSNREHPIMEGVNDLTIACASVIEPGPDDFALFYDTSNTYVLAGVAKIDTNPVSELRPAENSKMTLAPREDISNPRSTTGF